MSGNENTVSCRGPHGDIRIDLGALTDSYQHVDDDVKAKVWLDDDGDRLLFIRVRDRDDGRKFNEYSVPIPLKQETDSDRESNDER